MLFVDNMIIRSCSSICFKPYKAFRLKVFQDRLDQIKPIRTWYIVIIKTMDKLEVPTFILANNIIVIKPREIRA